MNSACNPTNDHTQEPALVDQHSNTENHTFDTDTYLLLLRRNSISMTLSPMDPIGTKPILSGPILSASSSGKPRDRTSTLSINDSLQALRENQATRFVHVEQSLEGINGELNHMKDVLTQLSTVQTASGGEVEGRSSEEATSTANEDRLQQIEERITKETSDLQEKTDALRVTMNTSVGYAQSNRAQLDQISHGLTTKLDGKLHSMQTAISGTHKVVEEGVSSLNDRITEIRTHDRANVQGLETLITGLDQRLGSLDARFDGIQGDLSNINTRIEKSQELSKTRHQELVSILTAVNNGISVECGAMNEPLSLITQQLKELGQVTKAVKEELAEMKSQQDRERKEWHTEIQILRSKMSTLEGGLENVRSESYYGSPLIQDERGAHMNGSGQQRPQLPASRPSSEIDPTRVVASSASNSTAPATPQKVPGRKGSVRRGLSKLADKFSFDRS